MKSECVQEALHCIHAHQHEERKCEEYQEADEHLKYKKVKAESIQVIILTMIDLPASPEVVVNDIF